MLDAVGGIGTVVFYRPVEQAAAVGAATATQRREAGVVDREGRPLAEDAAASGLALSLEKRALLARLRGEEAALGQELLRAPSPEGAARDEAALAREAAGGDAPAAGPDESAAGADEGAAQNQLSDEERAQVQELQTRDREVRAHEQAHATVGGQYAGAPSYEYQTGPDGRQYAVGGSVSIDVSPEAGDPQATVDKMRTVIDAALAPAEPSAADRAVAQAAKALMQEAMAEARAEDRAERAPAEAAESGGGPDDALVGAAQVLAATGYAQSRAATSGPTAPQIRLAA